MEVKNLQKLCLILLVFLMPVSAFAISLNEAAQQAARQHDAKVLSARTVQKGDNRVHEIKLLTRNGVVKTVRIPDNSNKRKKR
jgi:outer membrane lipoprotein-sorting protein